MKIATFNVWNENKGVGKRGRQIIGEILNTPADLIALQEITPRVYQEQLQKLPQYPYSMKSSKDPPSAFAASVFRSQPPHSSWKAPG